VRVQDRRHPFPQHPNRKHEPTWPVASSRYHGAAHCFHSAVSGSVSRCWHRQPHQLARGNLERVRQGHDLRETVQRPFPAFDLGQVRFRHPGEPSNDSQGLAPCIADLPQPRADRARVVSVHQKPLLTYPSPMPRGRHPGAEHLGEEAPPGYWPPYRVRWTR
jgi:hypothetical protein